MKGPGPDPERIERILAERARALARPVAIDTTAADSLELVVLRIGAERYGVDSRLVAETQTLPGLAAVPGLPPAGSWAGLVNLRGNLYPVLDLRRYLELPSGKGAEGGRVVVVVHAAGLAAGLMVDGVSEVRRVSRADIRPALTDAAGKTANVILGLTADLLAVLDLEAVLSDPTLVVQQGESI